MRSTDKQTIFYNIIIRVFPKRLSNNADILRFHTTPYRWQNYGEYKGINVVRGVQE